jgi:creatinine amidohydrolase
MNIFLRSVTVGLIPLALWAFASSASDTRVLMEEMTTTEVREAIKAGKTTVLIFSGSTEESGPHLVLGKHTFRARYLGERIARELGNTLVAPVLPFAPARPLTGFPGTITLSPETFAQVNEEVADSMVKAGFKYIILMGDHGGNQKPLEGLAPKLDEKYRSQGVRVFYAGDVYVQVWTRKRSLPQRTRLSAQWAWWHY